MLRMGRLLLILTLLNVSSLQIAHAAVPATGQIKMVTLGDSLTEGDGDEHQPPGWPSRVEAMLAKVRPGSKIINLGKSGWNSDALINGDQGLAGQLGQAVAAKPDIATVWIGSNDLWYLEGSSDEENLTHFTQNIDTILKTLHKTGATVFIALLDDQSKRPYALKSDVGYTDEMRTRISRFAGLFNQVITEKAKAYDATTVDFFHTTIFTDPATLYDDGNHPNSAGYDKIAQIWFDAISPFLTVYASTPAAIATPTISRTPDANGKKSLAQIAGCPIFPADNPWNQDISKAPLNKKSAAYIVNINSGGDTFLHADFGSNPEYGIPYTVVPGTQPAIPINFVEYSDESDPGPYPIPPNVSIEQGDDHHVLVINQGTCTLYELYHAQKAGSSWTAGSGAIFDLKSNALRPETWTSTDEAGLPIFPGLVRSDEVQAGAINHALRFTVWRTQHAYISPARHYGSSDDPNTPPMGLRLRLKANYDISKVTGQSKVIVTALKKYGMFVADTGSSWFISGATDSYWNDDDLEQLKRIPGNAFEVVETGPITKP